jgi:RsiW-degrading membrane proteinase PrsW (M82 family)
MESTQGTLARPAYQRKGVLRADLIAFVVLLLFVAAVVALDMLLKPTLSGPALLLIGVALALVPAALWLIIFRSLDRAEPEPVGDVVKIFVIGLALASGIGIPLTDQLFRVQDWLYHDIPTNVLASIFIVGAVEAFIVYATVRYFIYGQPEFDERTDGAVYGTAAGLGYATALNLQFILANRGAALGPGEIYVAEVALAHAALGGLLGYFLGKAKMQREPVWWLPVGFVLAALLNGVFYLLRGQLETGSIGFATEQQLPSVTALLLAGALAIVMSVIVAALINRDVRLTLAGRMPPREADAEVGDRRANWLVIGAFVLMLAIGALVWNGAVNGAIGFDKDGVRGAYPAYYTNQTGESELLRVSDPLGSGAEFIVTISSADSGMNTETAVALLAAERGGQYAVYKVLNSAPATVSGKPALMQRFSYVDAGGLGEGAPQLREGIDYIIVDDGRSFVITLLTTPERIQDVMPLFTRFVNSLSL